MKKAASYKKDIFLYPLLAVFLGILLIVFVFMYPILKDKTRECFCKSQWFNGAYFGTKLFELCDQIK